MHLQACTAYYTAPAKYYIVHAICLNKEVFKTTIHYIQYHTKYLGTMKKGHAVTQASFVNIASAFVAATTIKIESRLLFSAVELHVVTGHRRTLFLNYRIGS